MTIVLFIAILAVLILSHEFGHFITAKWSGMKVEEFGLGFPPRLFSWQKGETRYSVNLIPFGGFVKILGENPEVEGAETEEKSVSDKTRQFTARPKYLQAIVLLAGIICNWLLAWILISISLGIGLPAPVESGTKLVSPEAIHLVITTVVPGSPADKAGIKIGDEIAKIAELVKPSSEQVEQTVAKYANQELTLELKRGNIFTSKQSAGLATTTIIKVKPEAGVVAGQVAIGIGMAEMALNQLSPLAALFEGFKTTANLTYYTAGAIWHLLAQAITGQGSLAGITGPVGLVGMVGQASYLGLVYLLTFTALISINLAVINLVPFPALDGGRLLFLLIEAIKGSPVKPKIVNNLNLVGFVLLLLLMAVITYHDIVGLF